MEPEPVDTEAVDVPAWPPIRVTVGSSEHIETGKGKSRYTVYTILCEAACGTSWSVRRRYSEFREAVQDNHNSGVGSHAKLPPLQRGGTLQRFSEKTIAERTVRLQTWLNRALPMAAVEYSTGLGGGLRMLLTPIGAAGVVSMEDTVMRIIARGTLRSSTTEGGTDVCWLAPDGSAGKLVSLPELALALERSELGSDTLVFVPPCSLEDAVPLRDVIDVEEVRGVGHEELDAVVDMLQAQFDKMKPLGTTPRPVAARQGVDAVFTPAHTPPSTHMTCARGFFRAPVQLSGELAAVAERELGETAAVRTAALAELATLLQAREEKGEIFSRKDPEFLIAFLRARKFRVQDALQLLCNYNNYAREHLDLATAAVHPERFAGLWNTKSVHVLPGIAHDGSRMYALQGSLLRRHMDAAPDSVSTIEFETIVLNQLWFFARLLSDEYVQVCGLSIIVNMRDGVAFSQISNLLGNFSARQKKSLFGLLQDLLPLRFKGIFFMEPPRYVSVAISVAKKFMKKKLRQRIYLLKANYELLHSVAAPLACLPSHLGGSLTDCDGLTWFRAVLASPDSGMMSAVELGASTSIAA